MVKKQSRKPKSYLIVWKKRDCFVHAYDPLVHVTWFKDDSRQLIEYKQGKPFSWFPEEMTTIRCEGYKDYLNKQLVDNAKLKRNSFYGNMIEDLGLQKSTELTRDKWVLDKHLDLHCSTIRKRSVRPMISRNLNKLLWPRDLISTVSLCTNWLSYEC